MVVQNIDRYLQLVFHAANSTIRLRVERDS